MQQQRGSTGIKNSKQDRSVPQSGSMFCQDAGQSQQARHPRDHRCALTRQTSQKLVDVSATLSTGHMEWRGKVLNHDVDHCCLVGRPVVDEGTPTKQVDHKSSNVTVIPGKSNDSHGITDDGVVRGKRKRQQDIDNHQQVGHLVDHGGAPTQQANLDMSLVDALLSENHDPHGVTDDEVAQHKGGE